MSNIVPLWRRFQEGKRYIRGYLREYRLVVWLLSAPLIFFVFCILVGMSIPVMNTYSWHQRAVAGDPEAQRVLGNIYRTSNDLLLPGILPDKNRAIYWWRRSAQAGNGEAAYMLADVYSDEHTPSGNAQALYWYRAAVNDGFVTAAKDLANDYHKGLLGLPVDPRQAAYWQHKADALEKSRRDMESKE